MLSFPVPVRLDLPEGPAYTLHFEPLDRVPQRMQEAGLALGHALIVTDDTVGRLYLDELLNILEDAGWTPHAFSIPPGESSKSSATWLAVMDWALARRPSRQTPLLALGGGVVGDLAGFVAASLLRGIPLVHLPTTVISQVDSAIGGKTGINHASGKNLIGAFKRPAFVLADPTTLRTLPERDFVSGLAEAVKHALISDCGLSDLLTTHWEAVYKRREDILASVLRDAAAVKARVVMADELEGGARAFLNLGHTFGHAIELTSGYGTFTHGEAVALGTRAALHLSASLRGHPLEGSRTLPPPFEEADALVARIPTPPLGDLPTDALMDAMQSDKKRGSGGVRFVVLDAPGQPRLAEDVPDAFIVHAWEYARSVSAP